MGFVEKLNRAVSKNDSLLCVGLDVDRDKIPKDLREKPDGIIKFNERVITNTCDLVCCYKLNLAFYEAYGKEGFFSILETLDMIPDGIPVIIDGKRNDIGNTARMYAKAIFEVLKGDATTVNPYLGYDSVKPFLDYKDRYTFILCKTSNPSARDIQDLKVGNKKLYQIVAEKIKDWGENCGAVVGATYPDEVKEIREIIGKDRILLVPGIGKQGGDLKKSLSYGCVEGKNMIINVSRSIIYADEGSPEGIRKTAEVYRDEINKFRL